jgi:2',3'-cyclic-nucleotide 2'-phosphodiesterase (5'-nucleotidase family)
MHPFGNVACLQTVTGQQLLDMLEWSSRYVGAAEDGSFLHVSGATYKIDTTVPNTTKADDKDVWVSGPEVYRVYDVMIYNKDTNAWEPLDLNASYNLAGYNYTLRDLGGGFAMLDGGVNVQDYVMEDYMVLANYVQGFENGVVAADNSPLLAKYTNMKLDYSDVNGSGRIEIAPKESIPETGDTTAALWIGAACGLCVLALLKRRSMFR